nr:hypothetical protein [Tanacetum cinerariifolium]
MTTLAKFMIIASADNRPSMLEKSLYDSWKSRMDHYMENRENGRMILNSVQNGPLIWPTVTDEDGTTRTKKYDELSATKNIQADCDCKATNIVLQGLAVTVFNLGDDQIACLNKAMAFLTVVAFLRVMLLLPEETMQVDRQELLNAIIVKTEDLDAYDSDCDDVSNAQAVLMANLSNYGYDIISEEKNNKSLTAELERYKERVKTFKQILNVDLSSRERMIDSQMDDMIKEKLALKEQTDSLKQNLSKQIKEKEF